MQETIYKRKLFIITLPLGNSFLITLFCLGWPWHFVPRLSVFLSCSLKTRSVSGDSDVSKPKPKQNNKANIKTKKRKQKLWNELQATCTNYSVKDTLSLQATRGSIQWLQNLLFHHVLVIKLEAIKNKQTDTGIFESRFLQTKIQEREREGILIVSPSGIFSYHQTHL